MQPSATMANFHLLVQVAEANGEYVQFIPTYPNKITVLFPTGFPVESIIFSTRFYKTYIKLQQNGHFNLNQKTTDRNKLNTTGKQQDS